MFSFNNLLDGTTTIIIQHRNHKTRQNKIKHHNQKQARTTRTRREVNTFLNKINNKNNGGDNV